MVFGNACSELGCGFAVFSEDDNDWIDDADPPTLLWRWWPAY